MVCLYSLTTFRLISAESHLSAIARTLHLSISQLRVPRSPTPNTPLVVSQSVLDDQLTIIPSDPPFISSSVVEVHDPIEIASKIPLHETILDPKRGKANPSSECLWQRILSLVLHTESLMLSLITRKHALERALAIYSPPCIAPQSRSKPRDTQYTVIPVQRRQTGTSWACLFSNRHDLIRIWRVGIHIGRTRRSPSSLIPLPLCYLISAFSEDQTSSISTARNFTWHTLPYLPHLEPTLLESPRNSPRNIKKLS